MENFGGVDDTSFIKLWGMFLNKTSELIYEANKGKEIPLIFWTSDLTKAANLKSYFNPKKHILQIWTKSKDKDIADIVRGGFRTIFSTYDTLYLDCGYGNWLEKVIFSYSMIYFFLLICDKQDSANVNNCVFAFTPLI